MTETPNDPAEQDQLHLLMTDATHPIYTGKCPRCQYQFPVDDPPAAHWDCPRCEWMDDSI